jgi:hypothetical protein
MRLKTRGATSTSKGDDGKTNEEWYEEVSISEEFEVFDEKRYEEESYGEESYIEEWYDEETVVGHSYEEISIADKSKYALESRAQLEKVYEA